MCGIAAIFCDAAAVDPQALDAALRQLRHRGPDGVTTWLSADGRVGLGHARLSIVDIENGAQPVSNETGTVLAITNGEFYDYRSLRDRLQRSGHRFRTQSDAEVLVHLYEDHGIDCLEHLRGEFAFVLWDAARQRLFAARDRFGIKPLYYSVAPHGIYLASEAKGLFAAGRPARWDHASFQQQLFGCLAADRTLFDGILQVPAGHCLVASNGRHSLSRYWDVDYPVHTGAGSEPYRANGPYVERFRRDLEEAVITRLDADVPVGAFLSGGVDSSSVLGIAARHSRATMRAFTVGFGASGYSEEDIARETALHCDARHEVHTFTELDYAHALPEAVWHAESLAFNLHGVARYLLCERVHGAGIKALLSGEGADEVLGGYSFTRRDALQPSMPGSANATAPLDGLKSVRQALGFVPAWLQKLAVDRSVFRLLASEGDERKAAPFDVYANFLAQFDVEGQMRGRTPVQQSLYLWIKSILPNYVLVAERLEMAHAVEVRLPFLDHKLFDAVRGLPQSVLVDGTREKRLLRDAARPVLTDTVYGRPKQPFTAPSLASVKGSPMNDAVQDTLRGRAMASVPFFSQSLALSYMDHPLWSAPHMQAANDAAVMAMASACILQEKYGLT